MFILYHTILYYAILKYFIFVYTIPLQGYKDSCVNLVCWAPQETSWLRGDRVRMRELILAGSESSELSGTQDPGG